MSAKQSKQVKIIIVETISGYSEKKVYQIFKDNKFIQQFSSLETAKQNHPTAKIELL